MRQHAFKFTSTHEWLDFDESTELVTLGITHYAQSQLGDVVFVELPEMGQLLQSGESCAVVESVKTAADVYTPVSGEVVAINHELIDAPDLINQSPEREGWLVRLKVASLEGEFLSAEQYKSMLKDTQGT